MGFGYIMAGLIFLVNPNINIVDILPDFVGCLLIVIGLSKNAMLYESFSIAKDAFWHLTVIELVKTVSLIFLPYTDSTFILVLVFSFAVIEMMYFVPAVSKMFNAFYDLGIKFDCDKVYSKIKKREIVRGKRDSAGRLVRREVIVERSEGLRLYFQFFIIAKLAFSVLPELPALQLYDYIGSVNTNSLNYEQFKPIFYLFSWVIVIILGVIAAVRMCAYVNGIRRDKETIGRLRALYADCKIRRPKAFIARHMKKVLAVASVGAFFLIDVRLNSMNVFPNVIAAVFFIYTFVMLIKYDKLAVVGAVCSAVWAVLSVVNFKDSSDFFAEYEIDAIEWIIDASILYDKLTVNTYIEYAVGLAALVLFTATIYRVIKKHVDVLGGNFTHLQYSREARNAEIISICRFRFIFALIFGILTLAANAAYVNLILNYPVLWAVNLAIGIIWVVAAVQFVSAASELIYEKMQDED